jgi:hypothetical protein
MDSIGSRFQTSYGATYGTTQPPLKTARPFYSETSYKKAFCKPDDQEAYPASFQRRSRKWQGQFAPYGHPSDMLEEGQPIMTQKGTGDFGDTDSARHRNFSQGNIDLKGKKHFSERPTATWNSSKVGRTLNTTLAGRDPVQGRPTDRGGPSVYEIADRQRKSRNTLPSQRMEQIITMRPGEPEAAPDEFAHKGKTNFRRGRTSDTWESSKASAVLAPETVDDWEPIERGVRRMDLSHNTEWNDAKHYAHERVIPTWDSEAVKQDIQPEGYTDDWNESDGVRKFMFSTGSETSDGRWAKPRYGNKSFDSSGLFQDVEQKQGATKMSFSYGVELSTDRWVETRNNDTWGGDIATHGWGDPIENTHIYKEAELRKRFNNTFKSSEPLVDPSGEPISERLVETVHNFGERHPSRDNPTFNSQILARSNEAQKLSRGEETISKRGPGIGSHYGNSARPVPTFISCGTLNNRDSPTRQKRGGISNHLQGGVIRERPQPTYDSRKLEKNLIDAGDTQKRLYDTRWDAQRHVSQVDVGGPVTATHQLGVERTGKRIVPTYDSEKASKATFRRSSPTKRPVLDSEINPRHREHIKGSGPRKVGSDRIQVGTLG